MKEKPMIEYDIEKTEKIKFKDGSFGMRLVLRNGKKTDDIGEVVGTYDK